MQTRLGSAEARLEERIQEAALHVAVLEKTNEDAASHHDQVLQENRTRHEEVTEAATRDHAKKSSLARTLLSEKEEEVRILSSKVQELQSEIASGAPSERKIFEYAEIQSKRDAMHGVHG